MARRVHLHIGVEKTGTTALQRLLPTVNDQLHEAGWHYGNLRDYDNHHALALAALDPWEFEREELSALYAWHGVTPESQDEFTSMVQREIEADLDAYGQVLYCSEHLALELRTPADVSRLKEVLAPLSAQVTVSVLLRRQVEFVESIFATDVRGGRIADFDIEEALDSPSRYRYLTFLERWEAAFPGDLQVGVYREEWKDSQDALPIAFARLVGMPLPSLARLSAPRANRSLSRGHLEFLRHLNYVRQFVSSEEFEDLRRLFIAEGEHVAMVAPFQLSPDHRSRIVGTFHEENRHLHPWLCDEDITYLSSPGAPRRLGIPIQDEERQAALATYVQCLRAGGNLQ